MVKGDAEDRLAKARANQLKKHPHLASVQSPSTSPATKPETGDVHIPAKPSGDQNARAKSTSGDQNDTNKPPKAKKKPSPTVVAWKAIKENYPVTSVITINKDQVAKTPKRRGAADRFALYEDGMTVGKYLDVTKEKGISGALANADIRWDVAKGLISVK
jgi:hypothetical protein